MRLLISALLVLGAARPVLAQAGAPGPILPLEEAITLAEKNNPTHLQTLTQRQRASAALRTAYGSFLPSVTSDFGSSYREGRQQFFGGVSFGATSDVISSSAGVNVSAQYSGETFLAPRQQRASLEATDADINNSRQNLRANVVQQYLAALGAEARAILQDTLLASNQAQLELARARVQVGAAPLLDQRRAEVALVQQQVEVLRARNLAEFEKLRLFQLLGVPQPSDVRLTSTFTVTEPNVQLQELKDMARQQNPALNALRSRERVADVSVKSARSAYLPTLSLQTGVNGFTQQLNDINSSIATTRLQTLQSQRNCFTTDSIRRGSGLPSISAQCGLIDFTAADEAAIRDGNSVFPFRMTRNPIQFSAQLSLPIFQGFQRSQRVQEAEAGRRDAQYRIREQELTLTANITSAFNNLQTAYQSVRLQEQNSQTAREALELAQERFRVGANTLVDLSQARADYNRAATDLITANFDFHSAYSQLEAAVGRSLR